MQHQQQGEVLESKEEESKKSSSQPPSRAPKSEKRIKEREPVAIDWFKAHTMFAGEDSESDPQEAKKQRDALKELEEKTQYFFDTNFDNVDYEEYDKNMTDPKVRDKVTVKLMERNPKLKKANVQEFGKLIQQADKDLFFKVRDGQLTLDQLKARIMERVTGVRITVLDDLTRKHNITDDSKGVNYKLRDKFKEKQ